MIALDEYYSVIRQNNHYLAIQDRPNNVLLLEFYRGNAFKDGWFSRCWLVRNSSNMCSGLLRSFLLNIFNKYMEKDIDYMISNFQDIKKVISFRIDPVLDFIYEGIKI